MNDVHIINFSLTIIGWIAVAFLAYRIYTRQVEKTKIWRIVLLLFAGFFSLSFNFPSDGETTIKIAVLPLGIMILSLVFRNKKERWLVYRKYAWLGFWANYILLVTSLLSSPIHSVIYPEDKANTYIAEIEEVTLMMIHPSGKEQTISQQKLKDAVPTLSYKEFFPFEWFYETDNGERTEPNYVSEKFPYIINGIKSKWGSGIQSIIYMERDGKGILVSTPKGQYYFRSQHALFEEGEPK